MVGRGSKIARTRTCDRNSTKAEPSLDIQYIFNEMGGRENHRIRDKTILMTLDRANHRCLRFWRLIVMDNTNASMEL
jgi:hypothetical protein